MVKLTTEIEESSSNVIDYGTASHTLTCHRARMQVYGVLFRRRLRGEIVALDFQTRCRVTTSSQRLRSVKDVADGADAAKGTVVKCRLVGFFFGMDQKTGMLVNEC